jgi:hypothetical protein
MGQQENLKTDLKESYKKGGLAGSEVRPPSRAYERYFEGYIEEVVEIPGKKRRGAVRKYVAEYYVRQVKRFTLKCILSWAAMIAAITLFIFAAVRDADINRLWYMALAQGLSLLSFAWTVYGLFYFTFAPARMTVRQYRLGVKHYRLALKLAILFSGCTFIIRIVYGIIKKETSGLFILDLLLLAATVVFVLSVFFIEHSAIYYMEPNPEAED